MINENIKFIHQVAKKICRGDNEQSFSLFPKEMKEQIWKIFFDIMKDTDIKRGKELKNGGILCDNFEWSMCREWFLSRVRSELEMEYLLNKVPEELQVYQELEEQ